MSNLFESRDWFRGKPASVWFALNRRERSFLAGLLLLVLVGLVSRHMRMTQQEARPLPVTDGIPYEEN